jgi:hypothetical protein
MAYNPFSNNVYGATNIGSIDCFESDDQEIVIITGFGNSLDRTYEFPTDTPGPSVTDYIKLKSHATSNESIRRIFEQLDIIAALIANDE